MRDKPTSTSLGRQLSDNSTYKNLKVYLNFYCFLSPVDANSPLKLFTHAKTTINEIFKSIASYVNDSNKFLDGLFMNLNEDNSLLFIHV